MQNIKKPMETYSSLTVCDNFAPLNPIYTHIISDIVKCREYTGAAEKWAIIKQQSIQILYLQDYKRIILKYTTKLITY
jgi:hypothetical protein